jgi:hypothetical protein
LAWPRIKFRPRQESSDQTGASFGRSQKHKTADEVNVKDLHDKVQEGILENYFWSERSGGELLKLKRTESRAN